MNLARLIESTLASFDANLVTNAFLFLLLGLFLLACYSSERNKNLAFVAYAPTMLTTVGILGTFVGITVGLIGFNVQAINESIEVLLGGLKTAFISSLAGMFLALVFKGLETSGVLSSGRQDEIPGVVGPEEIHRELRDQSQSMERLVKAISGDEETALVSQVRLLRSEGRDSARETLAAIQGQQAIQQQLDGKAAIMLERFNGFQENLWKQLDDFGELLAKSATEQVIEALRQVISDFNENLTEQFGENFKQLNEAVGRLLEWQENYKEQLAHMTVQYNQAVRAIEGTRVAVGHIAEESKQIPVAMDALKPIIETAQQQVSELERHLGAFQDIRDRAVEAVPQIREQMDSMVREVSEAVQGAGARISESAIAAQSAIVEGAKSLDEQVRHSSENLQNAADQVISGTDRIRNATEESLSQMEQELKQLVSGMRERTTTMGETLIQANQRLASSVDETHSKVSQSIQEMQRKLEAVLDEVTQAQTRSTTAAFQRIEDGLKSTVAKHSDAMNEQLQALDKALQDELERAIQALGSNLAGVTHKFAEDYGDLTRQMAKVVANGSQLSAGGIAR